MPQGIDYSLVSRNLEKTRLKYSYLRNSNNQL